MHLVNKGVHTFTVRALAQATVFVLAVLAVALALLIVRRPPLFVFHRSVVRTFSGIFKLDHVAVL